MKRFPRFDHASAGQGGLVAVAVTIMIALVIAGAAITGLSKLNATRTVVMRQNLQTYYIAQAGIQEALATRMMPRSNYLSFLATAPQTALFPSSGQVFEVPGNTTSKVGIYRYVILGGDGAKTNAGGYYADNNMNPSGVPRIVATDTIPAASSFYIISNGMTCKNNADVTGRGAQAPTTSLSPSCPSGFTLEEVTLVAEAHLDNEDGSLDAIDRQWIFKDRTAITLPSSTFVPGVGGGWTNRVNFDRAWAANTTTNTPANPTYVSFYNFIDNTIYATAPINAAGVTTIPTQIPSNAVIRLYFDGPVDYRSFFRYNVNSCVNNANTCNIQVVSRPGMGETVYSGNTMVPVLPSGSQVILLPPLGNNLPGGTPHEIRISGGNTGIKSYSSAPMTQNQHVIRFTTK